MLSNTRIDTNVVGSSKLNPNAAEFVPGAFTQSTHPSTYVNNNQTLTLNGTSGDQPTGKLDDDNEPEDYVALCELKEFIDLISYNPASYDKKINFITDVLNSWCTEDPETITECCVNSIVDQAIMDQNFRYHGTRFCVHLIDNYKAITPKGTFKDLLLRRCQREHSRREVLARAQTPDYLRGVALFIAELSTQLKDANDLRDYLPELMETLLSRTTTDNIKCVCNILKLCGSQLEEHLSKKNSTQMDSIMDTLSSVQKKTTVQPLKNLINVILELRGNGWKAPQAPPSNIVNPYANGPIYDDYAAGPADVEAYEAMNAPETFYSPYSPYPNNAYNPSYDFGPCQDADNEDVCSAFDDFLRSSGQL